jgi:hypothetical protein
MSTRHSTYDLVEGETYVTPQWVYKALHGRFPKFAGAEDPFPENYARDALLEPFPHTFATNPPFSLADRIVAKAFEQGCNFALLLPATWDCAKSRISVCECLTAKLNLTKRIRWVNLEQKKNGPSSNHAWYIWDKGDKCKMMWA